MCSFSSTLALIDALARARLHGIPERVVDDNPRWDPCPCPTDKKGPEGTSRPNSSPGVHSGPCFLQLVKQIFRSGTFGDLKRHANALNFGRRAGSRRMTTNTACTVLFKPSRFQMAFQAFCACRRLSVGPTWTLADRSSSPGSYPARAMLRARGLPCAGHVDPPCAVRLTRDRCHPTTSCASAACS